MFKKMKLAPKLALVIGVVLAIVFTALISVTVGLSRTAISESIHGELTAISNGNANQIQQMFNSVGSAAASMQTYLDKANASAAKDPSLSVIPTDPDIIALTKSNIYKATLSSIGYDVEQFLSETARTTAVNNADIAGVGVFFAEYGFAPTMRDYAFYVNEENATGVIEPFGAYPTYSKESYYADAVAAQKAVVTDPYDEDGKKLVSYSIPFYSDNKIQGVIMADINVNNFSKVNATSERYKTMYATIYNDNGMIVYDSQDANDIGKSLSDFTPKQDDLAAMQAAMAKGQAFQIETTRESGVKVTRFFSPIIAGSETWWSLTALETSDVNEAVVNTVFWLLILSVVSLAIIIVIIVILLKRMLAPMKTVVSAAESIAKGDLNVQINATTQDEIGMLSIVFQKMADNLRAIIGDMGYLLGEMANGNFRIRSKETERYVGDYFGLLAAARNINSNLSNTLSQINQASDQVSSGSDQVSSGAQALSQGATEQASSVQQLAATINEISQQVQSNAENALTASKRSSAAGEEVMTSNRKMQELIAAMEEISHSSQEIGKVIKTIEDIAFQTNILALNAAVEAARAGAAGKGFAVVADEVRNLASKSADAAKGTTALIEGAIQAVANGTRLVDDTAKSLVSVVDGTQEVATLIDRISTASVEQADSISQVTQGIDQISAVVQTNSATSEESAAASEELSGQAQMLKDLVGQFTLREDAGAAATPSISTTSHALPHTGSTHSQKALSSADNY